MKLVEALGELPGQGAVDTLYPQAAPVNSGSNGRFLGDRHLGILSRAVKLPSPKNQHSGQYYPISKQNLFHTSLP